MSTLPHVLGLRCRECGARYPEAPQYVCDECFGPLEVEYDYDYIRAHVTRERIANGPWNLWRYADLLPVAADKRTKPAKAPAPQPRKAEPARAIQAYVPVSIAKALNMRAAQEDVTVRTLILQGLKAIGFDVPEEDLRDRRK